MGFRVAMKPLPSVSSLSAQAPAPNLESGGWGRTVWPHTFLLPTVCLNFSSFQTKYSQIPWDSVCPSKHLSLFLKANGNFSCIVRNILIALCQRHTEDWVSWFLSSEGTLQILHRDTKTLHPFLISSTSGPGGAGDMQPHPGPPPVLLDFQACGEQPMCLGHAPPLFSPRGPQLSLASLLLVPRVGHSSITLCQSPRTWGLGVEVSSPPIISG